MTLTQALMWIFLPLKIQKGEPEKKKTEKPKAPPRSAQPPSGQRTKVKRGGKQTVQSRSRSSSSLQSSPSLKLHPCL